MSVTDLALVLQIKKGNEDALAQLFQRYKPLVDKCAYQYRMLLMDYEDIVQESRIVLYEATHKFNESKQVPFAAFYQRLLRNKMCALMRQYMAMKRRADKMSISCDDTVFEQQANYVAQQYMDPLTIVTLKETLQSSVDNMSLNERKALYTCCIKDAGTTSKEKHAMTRCKRKIKQAFQQE